MKFTRALIVILSVAFAVSLNADQSCSSKLEITNNTGKKLKLSKVNLPWGRWCIGPPLEIAPWAKAEMLACGRMASPSGTEGSLKYETEDGKTAFWWSFVSAYEGHHRASVEPWGQIALDTSGINRCWDHSEWPSKCWHCWTTAVATIPAAKDKP